MKKILKAGKIPFFVCLVIITAVLVVIFIFRADMRYARQRIANSSHIINTNCGPMEYGELGSGQPVLVIHGAGGGFDQGMLLGEMMLGDNYHVIAPSRFGYLNAGLSSDTSLENQAAHFLCLLDALNITEPVIVMPVSAGGPSGLHFARDYPDRTRALVTVSAISYSVPAIQDKMKEQLINKIVGSDFVYWAVTKVFPKKLLQVFGVTQQVQLSFSQTEWDQVAAVYEVMLPASDRFEGVLLDQTRIVPEDFVEMIDVPTLVFHAEDDTLVDSMNAEHASAGIKGSILVQYPTGGHFQLGNITDIQMQIENFLKQLD